MISFDNVHIKLAAAVKSQDNLDHAHLHESQFVGIVRIENLHTHGPKL